MSYAFVQDVPATWDTYREHRRNLSPDRPEGLVLHAAGPTDEGFRMIGIWEAPEAWRLFRGDRLDPILEAIAGGSRLRATVREWRSPISCRESTCARRPLARVHIGVARKCERVTRRVGVTEWQEPILIVGGGRAAASLIDAYREEGGDALITVVSTDDQPPYNRPPLSKGVLRGEMEPLEALVHTAEEWDDNLVELRLETSVEAVDTDGRTVTLAGGETLP